VIDDHARAVSFLIADGVMPSNEGRGYVLRRLLRRAARHGRLLDLKEPFLHEVTKTVAEVMGDAYPDVRAEEQRIREVIRTEEERFVETLEKGTLIIQDYLQAHEAKAQSEIQTPLTVDGGFLFTLYDTYGFPRDLAQEIFEDAGWRVTDETEAAWEIAMSEQRNRGREARAITLNIYDQIAMSDAVQVQVNRGTANTCFVGYDRLQAESAVLAIYGGGIGKPEAIEGEEFDLFTAETPFYGESGGQVGDRGTITTARGDVIEVFDTQHPTPQLIAHRGKVKKGRVQVGDKVFLQVDPKYRQKTRLNHSATHILHSVLRQELGPHVRQAGSLVAPDRLRFDFNHTGAIAEEKLEAIETAVNQHVRENAEVSIRELKYDEAIREGALAFFGDKYGDRVRVVKIGDFSTELCGGTHVRSSGEIGLFKLHFEGGVAAGVRRVEAFTGEGALALIHSYEDRLREIGALVRGTPEDAADKVRRLLDHQKELEKEIDKLRGQFEQDQVRELLAKQRAVDGAKVLISQVDNLDAKQLRDIADRLKEKLGSGIVVLASAGAGNVNLVATVTKDLTKRYHAGNIIKELAAMLGGGGGGRPEFAQAGGKHAGKISEALRRAEELVQATK
jgi:alanyl-tRNA synthetase